MGELLRGPEPFLTSAKFWSKIHPQFEPKERTFSEEKLGLMISGPEQFEEERKQWGEVKPIWQCQKQEYHKSQTLWIFTEYCSTVRGTKREDLSRNIESSLYLISIWSRPCVNWQRRAGACWRVGAAAWGRKNSTQVWSSLKHAYVPNSNKSQTTRRRATSVILFHLYQKGVGILSDLRSCIIYPF